MSIVDLMNVAGRQHGCITWEQGLAVTNRNQLYRLARKGIIERRQPAVYAVVGTEPTWQQQMMALTLSLPGSVVSHQSAAYSWGLTTADDEWLHVTIPGDRTAKRSGARIHHSLQLERFVTRVDGIPVTTVARTLVDLAGSVDPVKLGRALDQACNLKLVRLEDVERCLDRMVTAGRSGISVLRQHLANRSTTDERLDTFLERKVLQWMRDAKFPEPEGQLWVTVNGNRYRPDFSYPALRIAIEPDGPHHLLASNAAHDRKRNSDFAVEGWIVIRVGIDTDEFEFLPLLRAAFRHRAAMG